MGSRRARFKSSVCHGSSLGDVGPVLYFQANLHYRIAVRTKRRRGGGYKLLCSHCGETQLGIEVNYIIKIAEVGRRIKGRLVNG